LVYETYLEVLCHFYIYAQTTEWRSGGIRQIARANYLFYGLNDKTDLVTRLAPSTDEDIEERIRASTSSYTTKSNEDTFIMDIVFEIFHHQASPDF